MLRQWAEEQTFQASLAHRADAPEYLFMMDSATGPHYGHFVGRNDQNIIPRYQTMRGNLVERRFGWDCHGLPIEALAQALGLAELSLKTGLIRLMSSVARWFRRMFQSEKTVTCMGRWQILRTRKKWIVRLWNIWWVLIWEQGRIYRRIESCRTVGSSTRRCRLKPVELSGCADPALRR